MSERLNQFTRPFREGYVHISFSEDDLKNSLSNSLVEHGFEQTRADFKSSLVDFRYHSLSKNTLGGVDWVNNICNLSMANIVEFAEKSYFSGMNQNPENFNKNVGIEPRLANLNFTLETVWLHERQHLIQDIVRSSKKIGETDEYTYLNRARIATIGLFCSSMSTILIGEYGKQASLGQLTSAFATAFYMGVLIKNIIPLVALHNADENEAYGTSNLSEKETGLFRVDYESH